MKILIITTDYYPDLTPNTYRWEAIATHWVNQGIEVHVLAPHRYSESGFIIRKGVQVHRKGSNTLLDWVYNAFKIKKLRNRVRTEPDQGKPAKWQILLNKLVSFTWRKIYWPDGSCLWYFTARKKAVQLIKTYQPDVIISICLPFTATLIGSY